MNEEVKLYPTNINKYLGTIFEHKDRTTKKFQTRIKSKNPRLSRNNYFKTYDEAKDFIIKINKKFDLPIRNIYYDKGTYYEVETSGKNRFKIDKNYLPLIEKYIWYCCFDKFYQVYTFTTNGEKVVYLADLLLKHTLADEIIIYHLNNDSLDYRLFNLALQVKNCKIMLPYAFKLAIYELSTLGINLRIGIEYMTCIRYPSEILKFISMNISNKE